MDKVKELEASFNYGFSVSERKNIVVSGVKRIVSFDSLEFLIDTSLGMLSVKGCDLEIVKLDTYQGTISIKGRIDSMIYLEESNIKNKDESFWGKLFK